MTVAATLGSDAGVEGREDAGQLRFRQIIQVFRPVVALSRETVSREGGSEDGPEVVFSPQTRIVAAVRCVDSKARKDTIHDHPTQSVRLGSGAPDFGDCGVQIPGQSKAQILPICEARSRIQILHGLNATFRKALPAFGVDISGFQPAFAGPPLGFTGSLPEAPIRERLNLCEGGHNQ